MNETNLAWLLLVCFGCAAATTGCITSASGKPAGVSSPRGEKGRHDRELGSGSEGDLAPAIKELSKAITINPKNALAYEHRAAAHLAKRHLDEAISDFSQAIQLDPTNVRARFGRGSAYRAKGE